MSEKHKNQHVSGRERDRARARELDRELEAVRARRRELELELERGAELKRTREHVLKAAATFEMPIAENNRAAEAAEEEKRSEKQLGPLAHCRTALDVLGDIVPPRVNEEEIGDALERIHMIAATGAPIWLLYLRTATSIWWILLHVLLHSLQRGAAMVQVAMGKGDDK